MAVIIGAVLGLFVFALSVVIGLIYRVPLQDVLLRGILTLWIGFLLGWLVFGNLGILNISKSEQNEKGHSANVGSSSK